MDLEASKILQRHGKSFYWARLFLPNNIAAEATTLYRFCRFLDDIADGDLPGGGDRLINIDGQIKGTISINEKEVSHFLQLADKKKLDLDIVHQLILGLISDQKKVLVQSTFELVQYSYRVAGTVGLMMAPILGSRDKNAEPFAIDLGIAMQLTNISRDLLEDATLGRRYIPENWCEGIRPEEIVQVAADPYEEKRRNILANSIDRLLLLAEDYYRSGLAGLCYLPPRCHLSMGIAAFVYREIGEQLRRKNLEWWRGRQVVGILGKVSSSMSFLPELNVRLKRPFIHNKNLHKGLEELPGVNIK